MDKRAWNERSRVRSHRAAAMRAMGLRWQKNQFGSIAPRKERDLFRELAFYCKKPIGPASRRLRFPYSVFYCQKNEASAAEPKSTSDGMSILVRQLKSQIPSRKRGMGTPEPVFGPLAKGACESLAAFAQVTR